MSTRRKSTGREKPGSKGTCQVTLIPGGPALVRGADEIVDADGRGHPVSRPVVAVCTCGLSQRRPWCDDTHKVAARDVSRDSGPSR